MTIRAITFTPWQRDFAVLVLPAVALLACSFLLITLKDADTYWHLATGRWILAHGGPPKVDPFSFTFLGRPWVTHEWLSEVVFALADRFGGLPGVLLVTAGALAGCVAIIGARIRRQLGALATILVLGGVVAMITPSFLARPHILVLPILATWTGALMDAQRDGRKPSLLLIPLMALWANLHGSYVFGLLLVGPFGLEALIAAPPRARLRTAVRWGGFGLAALAASAVTPHGLPGLVFPFQLMTMGSIGVINEWKSANFSELGPMEVVLLAAIFVCLWRGVRIPLVRLALLLLLLHMALAHVRHGVVLAVVGALILAEPLGKAVPPDPRAAGPLSPRERRGLIAAATGLLLAVVALRLAIPLAPPDTRNTPATALSHVPAELRLRPVFNDYGFGGLLIFDGIRPFIDGRADLYGDAFVRRYVRITYADRAAFDRAVRQYGIAWVIFRPRTLFVQMLDATPGWRRLYADEYAVVFARTPAPAAPPRAGGDPS